MYLVTCFKKLFRSPAFWLSVAATAVICMFSELYRDPQGKTKNVIEMFMQYSKNAMLSNVELCSYSVFIRGFGNWVAMFVPVIVSIASINIFVDERKSGIWRYELHRTGRTRYSIGGCLFILLSGGVVLTLGYALFGALAVIMFPPLSAYPEESAELFVEMYFSQGVMSGIYRSGGLLLCSAAQLAEVFFYGAVCSAAAMLLSAVSENKYIVICAPFFLKYALDQLSTLLLVKAIEDSAESNKELMNFAQIIDPDASKSFLSDTEHLLAVIIVNAAYLLILSALFCIIRIRRLKNET